MAENRVAWLIASVCGVGLSPAPGTAGSAVAALAGAVLLMHSPLWLMAGIILSIVAGFWAIPRAGGAQDPGWVVIDEVAGQWIAMLAIGHCTIVQIGAAFALFRLFDIAKPGPVGWADRRKGAVGVMLDDLIAGALAAVVLLGVRQIFPHL